MHVHGKSLPTPVTPHPTKDWLGLLWVLGSGEYLSNDNPFKITIDSNFCELEYMKAPM
jgi:hypothetical protein